MRTFGLLLLALGFSAGASLAMSAPAFAKGKSRGGESAAPANAAEINKLKAVRLGDPKAGVFKWQMSPEEVMGQIRDSIKAGKYQARIEGAVQDPGKQQRIREEMEKELKAVKDSYAKFEGQKTGWDVSIIGPEFQQNTGEAVLISKEEIGTRYFFFFENGLYKMFLSFNKEAIGKNTFREFGKSMEAKYGRAKEIYRDEKVKDGMRHLLDHYEWSAGGDKLRLIDRSEFYGVYCLVLVDSNAQDRENEKRKYTNPDQKSGDSLVEAVTAKGGDERDSNDNIIDRITGKEIRKPGDEQKHADIVVPSPSGHSKPTSTEASAPAAKDSKKKSGKKDSALDGLEL